MHPPNEPIEAHFLIHDARSEALLLAALSAPHRPGCVLRAATTEHALALLGRGGPFGLLVVCGGLADGRGPRLLAALRAAGRLEGATVLLMDALAARLRFDGSGSASLRLHEEPAEPRRLTELAGGDAAWTLARFC